MTEEKSTWYGVIPERWKVQRIKTIFSLRDERNYQSLEDVNLISLYSNKGVMQHSDIDKTSGNKARNADGYKKVYKDDIIVNILLCWMGAIGYSAYEGVTSPAYDVYKQKIDINSMYYHYLFRTKSFSGECYKAGKGIMMMRWRTYSPQFMNIFVPVPPRAEQNQIVRFLDWKVSEINKLIGIRKREVIALKDLNEVIIEKAITMGIDDVTVFKLTDLNYLPEIPDTWELLKLKHVCKVGASVTKKLKQYADQDMVVFLPMENISANGEINCSIKVPLGKVKSGFSSFAKGDVVVAKITPCFENGKGACLNTLESDIGYGTTELFNLRPFDNVLSEYLYYITKTKLFRVLGEGCMTGSAGQKRVPIEFIKNFMVGIPPLQEQKQIINYILQKTSNLKKQIEIKNKQIQQLLEVKNTIISDVVTGKIDVRNVVIPVYEHIDDANDAGYGEDGDKEITDEEMEV